MARLVAGILLEGGGGAGEVVIGPGPNTITPKATNPLINRGFVRQVTRNFGLVKAMTANLLCFATGLLAGPPGSTGACLTMVRSPARTPRVLRRHGIGPSAPRTLGAAVDAGH